MNNHQAWLVVPWNQEGLVPWYIEWALPLPHHLFHWYTSKTSVRHSVFLTHMYYKSNTHSFRHSCQGSQGLIFSNSNGDKKMWGLKELSKLFLELAQEKMQPSRKKNMHLYPPWQCLDTQYQQVPICQPKLQPPMPPPRMEQPSSLTTSPVSINDPTSQ